MKTTHYTLSAPIATSCTIAHVSDLHGQPHRALLAALQKAVPDVIAITGDLFDTLASAPDVCSFLRACAAVAPTVYALGNHERLADGDIDTIRSCGVILLQNEATVCQNLVVGGLNSGFRNRREQSHFAQTPKPDTDFLARFAAMEGYKLLLCHHPEYYPAYIRPLPIDLTLSGHAHGGQWRVGKQGVFAPGQGFFPRYSGGIYENRLIVSCGLANTAPFPRFGNPTELVLIHLRPS